VSFLFIVKFGKNKKDKSQKQKIIVFDLLFIQIIITKELITIKKTFCFVVLFIFVFCSSIYATSISWYCKKSKDHTQPELGNDLKIVDDFDVYWCDKNHKQMTDDDKVIYLTFDAGYENGNVEKIVESLNNEGVKGNFFILDNLIIKNEELVKKMIESGHIIANHTAKHKDMSKIKCKDDFEKELKNLEVLYKTKTGKEISKYYRPPEGKFSKENLEWASELGYKTVFWSFAYADWDNNRQISSEKALKKIMDNIHNGEVLLLHPTSSTNAEIMGDLIKQLKNEGFRFGTLDELCGA